MDEPMRKSGQYPNVAIEAGSDPKEVMGEYREDDSDHSEAECSHSNVSQLQAKVDELTAEVKAQRERANKAEKGLLQEGWYVSRDRYEDDIAELTAERDKLAKARDVWIGYHNDMQADRDKWQDKARMLLDKCDELTAEIDRLRKVVQVQAESFQKLERELKEALDGQAT